MRPRRRLCKSLKPSLKSAAAFIPIFQSFMFELITSLLFLFTVLAVFATMAWASLSAAPFVPLRRRDVKRLLDLAQVKPGEVVYDLGSGDGRILIMASRKFRARACGFEISLLLLFWSRLWILLSGQSKNIKVSFKSFYKENLNRARVVTCFLTQKAMRRLEPKFEQELRPGSRVVSYAFALPSRKPDGVDKPSPKLATVYLYRY